MADTATMPIGIPKDDNGNISPVFLVGAAVAVVAGVYMLAKKSGGSGTVAAGSSINAALGSLQEENLALQGQIGSLQQGTYTGLGEISQQVLATREIISLLPGGQAAYKAWLDSHNVPTGGAGTIPITITQDPNGNLILSTLNMGASTADNSVAHQQATASGTF